MSQIKNAPAESKPRGRDYGYCNARVRGMRARLFSKAFLDELLGSRDVKSIINQLSSTGYGPDLEKTLLHGQTFAQVDEALKENLVRTFRKVLDIVNGEASVLATTLLGRWDLLNIKTIIRGKHMTLSEQEIVESLLPVGQLTPVELQALAGADSVKAVVDTMRVWGLAYATPLQEKMPEYLETKDLSSLELALDRYYCGWASDKLNKAHRANYKLAYDFLGVQIDSMNLLTVFRLLKADIEGIDAQQFFLPGGKEIGLGLFRELTALSDIDEVLDRLRRTPYGKPLEGAALMYAESGSIAVLERVLEDFVMRRAFAMSRVDSLGAGVVISYLWAKQNEVTNLRIIVKGTSVGMPSERMRGELIFV